MASVPPECSHSSLPGTLAGKKNICTLYVTLPWASNLNVKLQICALHCTENLPMSHQSVCCWPQHKLQLPSVMVRISRRGLNLSDWARQGTGGQNILSQHFKYKMCTARCWVGDFKKKSMVCTFKCHLLTIARFSTCLPTVCWQMYCVRNWLIVGAARSKESTFSTKCSILNTCFLV